MIGLMVGSIGCIGILALLGVWSQFECLWLQVTSIWNLNSRVDL